MLDTGMKRTGFGMRYGGYGAAAFDTQVGPFDKIRGINDQAGVRRQNDVRPVASPIGCRTLRHPVGRKIHHGVRYRRPPLR